MAKQAPKEGVFIGKNSRGFYYRIKQNQHILAFAGGYNTKQNAKNGVIALHRLLNSSIAGITLVSTSNPQELVYTDLTKKTAKKK